MRKLHNIGKFLLSAIAVLGLAASASAATLPDDVQAIVKRGELRVGVKSDVPGFSMQDLSGEYAGMEVDLAKKLAEAFGLELFDADRVYALVKEGGRMPQIKASASYSCRRSFSVCFGTRSGPIRRIFFWASTGGRDWMSTLRGTTVSRWPSRKSTGGCTGSSTSAMRCTRSWNGRCVRRRAGR